MRFPKITMRWPISTGLVMPISPPRHVMVIATAVVEVVPARAKPPLESQQVQCVE